MIVVYFLRTCNPGPKSHDYIMRTYGFHHSLHLIFYLYLVHCTPPSLSRTNRTWSCSVWYDHLSVPVESHDRLPLFLNFNQVLCPYSWHSWNHSRVPFLRPCTCLALQVQKITSAIERCYVSLTEETTNTKHTHKWSEAQWLSDVIHTKLVSKTLINPDCDCGYAICLNLDDARA